MCTFNVAINPFVRRQININPLLSTYGGFVGDTDDLIQQIIFYDDSDFKEGFAPFVRILEILPCHLSRFVATHREAKSGETIITRLERRRPEETPVPVNYVLGEKEPGEAARLIFYSHEQLEAEGEPTTPGSDWELISINVGPEDEPMSPSTLWRNYFASREAYKDDPRAVGGSPHFADKTDEEFIKELARSEEYWKNRGIAVIEIPKLTDEQKP